MKQLQLEIEKLLSEREKVVIAIDGPCASGKTTLATALSEIFDCNVIHMDDFFLRPEQRTPERFAEVGGNLDRERFLEEVLIPLARYEEFTYRPYLCSMGKLGDPIAVSKKKLYVIEGSYSHHPFFGDACYDLRIFLKISPTMQKERLEKRSPQLLERFLREWIPLEDAYFEKFHIESRADLCVEVKENS